MRSDLYAQMYRQEEHYWWHISRRNLVKQLLPSGRRLHLLDIGCGTGKLLEELQGYGEAFGIDFNLQAIRFCHRRRLKRVYLDKFPKLRSSLRRQTFDVVTCLDVLEHIDSETTALRTIKKLLRPGGRLIMTVPAYPWLFSYWDEMSGHYRRYSRDHLLRVLRKTGLEPIKVSYLYSFLMPIAVPFRYLKHLLFKHKTPPSDFITLHPFTNKLLLSLATLEQFLLRYVNIPFGLSLICIVEKHES